VWLFDKAAQASLLMIRFAQDGTREISIELAAKALQA
jgi:hypothetical protein